MPRTRTNHQGRFSVRKGARASAKSSTRPVQNGSSQIRMPKVIVCTGGVISGLGKGVATASIGNLLSEKYRVVPVKCDGYLNVDPGTMNPIEHGEVFVLDDGTEVDMDFGHYERFLGVTCKGNWNLTMGKVFDLARIKERAGDYLGKTVQFIPHVTDLIQNWWLGIALVERADVLLIEIGGTVGDMENQLYIEAARQLKKRLGDGNILYVHLTYVPVPGGVNEQKSKPTQQSVGMLREAGIFPDVIIARSKEVLSSQVKTKIALFSDVPEEAIISGEDVRNIYEIPISFRTQGLAAYIERRLGLAQRSGFRAWDAHAHRLSLLSARPLTVRVPTVTIALCGKYTRLEDSYASIEEALAHASAHAGCAFEIRLVETTDVRHEGDVGKLLAGVDAVIIPGGFGSRGVEGKILVAQYCREHRVPFLGICLGLQLAVVEFARNVCGLAGANSTEMDPKAKHPVIDIMPEQEGVVDKGATMRLGAYPAKMRAGSKVRKLYNNAAIVSERHRHRYEVNPAYHRALEEKGLIFSGMSPDGRLVEFIELAERVHPYFVATQAHPELTSNLLRPGPLFFGLIKAALAQKRT